MPGTHDLPLPPPANFIGNRWLESSGPPVIVTNPGDEHDLVGEVADSTVSDVQVAIDAAAEACPAWSATPAPARGEVLRRWRDLIGRHRESLARLMTREMGKPFAETLAEVDRAQDEVEYAVGESTRIHGTTVPSRIAGQEITVRREPIGVVAGVTPWNFPAIAPVRKIAPALVYGNTIVLKPALETPLTALTLGDLLREAGAPTGVVNVVTGRGSVIGEHLATDRRVAGVSFTGSTAVGQRLSKAVSGRMVRLQLELGGKNAAYVHSAADLAGVADELTSAALQATGQRCTAISRLIVADELADEFVHLLAQRWDGVQIGPGLEPGTVVGPLINHAQRDMVDNYVHRGIADGATRRTTQRPVPDGPYYPPTILDHVTPEMAVAREEIFGPVLAVLRAGDVDEAIGIANATEFGLAAAVFTDDVAVATRFSQAVDAGMVHINHGTASQPHVPFGGTRNSGHGPFAIGFTAVEFYTRTKVVYLQAGA